MSAIVELRNAAMPDSVNQVELTTGGGWVWERYQHIPAHEHIGMPVCPHHWLVLTAGASPFDITVDLPDGSLRHHHRPSRGPQLIYLPPFVPTQWSFSPVESGWQLLVPDVQLMWTAEEVGVPIRDLEAPAHIIDDGPLISLVRKCKLSPQDTAAIARRLCRHLGSRHRSEDDAAQSQRDSDRLARRALEVLTERRLLKIGDLASTLDCSPEHLCRSFRETYGRTISQHLQACRLRRARRILADPRKSDWTIQAVAREAGFYDPAHMTHHFGRAFGMSPARYRSLQL